MNSRSHKYQIGHEALDSRPHLLFINVCRRQPRPLQILIPQSCNLSSQGAGSSRQLSFSLFNIPYLLTPLEDPSYGFNLISLLHEGTAKLRLLFKIRMERSFAFAGRQQVKCVRKLQNLKCLRTFKKMMFKSSSDLGEPAKCWALCQAFAEGNPFLPCMKRHLPPSACYGKITARLEMVRVVQAHVAQEEAWKLRSG